MRLYGISPTVKRIILGKCVDGLKKSVDRRWISWRFYGKHFIQFVQTTSQSGIHFVNTAAHRLYMGQRELEPEPEVFIERRKIFAGFDERIEAGQTLAIEKYSTVYTSRDKEAEGKTWQISRRFRWTPAGKRKNSAMEC